MRVLWIRLTMTTLAGLPAAHADIELAGHLLQIYGELHGSADYYHRGTPTAAVPEPRGIEITSNSSHIGFKGEAALTGRARLLWKFESEVDLSGELGTFDTRDRYIGVATVAGSVLLGAHNTPLKEIGSRYTLFNDTVGDRSGILGQTATGDDRFNQRARSMLLYQTGVGDLHGAVMYSPDFAAGTNPDTGDAGVSSRLVGIGLGYHRSHVDITVAGEQQTSIDNIAGRDARGIRVGLAVRLAAVRFGGVLEMSKDDGAGAVVERNAWAANIAYDLGAFTVAGQYMKAGASARPQGDDGAKQYTLGLYYSFSPGRQLYLVYAQLDNDLNAAYRLARSGHGQVFAPTENGTRVAAASIGAIYDF